jgi:hypothetical protein
VGYGYGTACCYAAGYEGAGEGRHQYMLLKTLQNLDGAYPSVVDIFLLYATELRARWGVREALFWQFWCYAVCYRSIMGTNRRSLQKKV